MACQLKTYRNLHATRFKYKGLSHSINGIGEKNIIMFTGVYPIDRYILQHRCRIYDTLYSSHFRFVRVRFKRRFTISRRYGKQIL